MSGTPREILLARAVLHLERTQLEIGAENYRSAAIFLEEGLRLVKEAVSG